MAEEQTAVAEEQPETPPEAEAKTDVPRSPVQDALKGARERMEKGESIVPEPEDVEDAPEEPTEEEAEPTAAEEGGEDPDAAEAEEEATEDGEPASEGDAEEVEEEESEPEAEFVPFELPARQKDGDPVTVELPAELEEDFARLRNGYMRGEEARAVFDKAQAIRDEVAEDRAEIDYIDRELKDDPAGFILQHVKAPEIRMEILRTLVADEDVWKNEDFVDMLSRLHREPELREQVRVRAERDRLKGERERDQRRQQDTEVRAGVRHTAQIIRSMIPEDMEPERGHKFYRLALGEMADLAGELGRTKLSREEIVSHLDTQGILEGYGIDPELAGTDAPTRGVSPSGKNTPKARPNRVRPRVVSEEDARKTGEDLKARGERQRAARGIAPEGAGTPAATVELPREGVKERIARIRRHGFESVTGA